MEEKFIAAWAAKRRTEADLSELRQCVLCQSFSRFCRHVLSLRFMFSSSPVKQNSNLK